MPTSSSATTGSESYHHGDLRSQLLRKCRKQLRNGGIEAISLRKAAQDIGVSHAAPARHFSDRRALLTALAAQGFTEAAGALKAALSGQSDRLNAICATYVAFALEDTNRYALMAQSRLIDISDR